VGRPGDSGRAGLGVAGGWPGSGEPPRRVADGRGRQAVGPGVGRPGGGAARGWGGPGVARPGEWPAHGRRRAGGAGFAWRAGPGMAGGKQRDRRYPGVPRHVRLARPLERATPARRGPPLPEQRRAGALLRPRRRHRRAALPARRPARARIPAAGRTGGAMRTASSRASGGPACLGRAGAIGLPWPGGRLVPPPASCSAARAPPRPGGVDGTLLIAPFLPARTYGASRNTESGAATQLRRGAP